MSSSFNRREFVSLTGAALLTARGYSQITGAGERLRIGVIGCGGMAFSHMRALVKMKETDNVEIVSVCDVYDNRARDAAQLTGATKVHRDYRRVLDDKDVDYVLIATPEHWHFKQIMDALDAGKHIYCEKPMTQTSEQSRRVVARARQTPLKMQVGVQGMSDDSYETANKFVRDGALGKVVIAQIDYSRNYKGDFWTGKTDPDIKPGVNFDWNMWLGPARKRPFDPERYFHWRRYWDYSGGIASDLFIHRVTRIIKSLDLKFPEYGVATGGKWNFRDSVAEIPETFNILLDYPGGPTVSLVSSMANDAPVEHVLRGHKATLQFTRTGFVIRPQGLYKDQVQEVAHQKTGAEAVDLHHRNLIGAIRHNEPLKCDPQLGYYGVVACEMGVQSFRKRCYMRWDSGRERIVKA